MNTITLEQVEGLAAQLLPQEQLQLLARVSERLSDLLIAHDLSSPPVESEPHKSYEWMSLRGIAPNLLEGEDAQTWVSRARSETDEHLISQ